MFVHGYSVHEEAARAWNSEIFKRLYQSGSRSMFTAATWQGNSSQMWDWIPFVGGSTPDYYENVENAFATAPHLATQVSTLPGTKLIAGHSLGNMVVSSADIRHPDWQDYSTHLWASKWHTLFPSGDSRKALTWGDRFGGITNSINYYSSTEDVLDNANNNVPPFDKERAWVCQEMRKGTTLFWIAPGNAEGGWGFNSAYDVVVDHIPEAGDIYGRMPPAQANALSNSTLQAASFFYSFDDEELYGANGSSFLLDGESDVRDSVIYRRLLADAIPALSNPTGRNSIESYNEGQNKNYMSFKRGLYKDGDWPREDDRWWHSDIKNIAFPFNSKAFGEIVTDGGLK